MGMVGAASSAAAQNWLPPPVMAGGCGSPGGGFGWGWLGPEADEIEVLIWEAYEIGSPRPACWAGAY